MSDNVGNTAATQRAVRGGSLWRDKVTGEEVLVIRGQRVLSVPEHPEIGTVGMCTYGYVNSPERLGLGHIDDFREKFEWVAGRLSKESQAAATTVTGSEETIEFI